MTLPVRNSAILLVDDEPGVTSALRRLLAPEGYKLFQAANAEEGLAVLQWEPVDVVISDMRMPGQNGAEFFEHVAARWPETVRILLTGYADMDSTVAAVNRGHIHAYITKPWDSEQVKRMVADALERKHQRELHRRLDAFQRIRRAEHAVQNDGGMHELLQRIVADAVALTGAVRGAVVLFQEGQPLLTTVQDWDEKQVCALVEGSVLPDGVISHCLTIINDVTQGILFLAPPPDSGFSEEQRLILAAYAAEAEHVIERGLLLESLHENNRLLRREMEEHRTALTQLQEAHTQLLQSEKMAAIGQLAAGVAHEINNPVGYVNSNLGTLRGYVESLFTMLDAYGDAKLADEQQATRLAELRKKLELDYLKQDALELLDETQDGVQRVRRIVQDLKDFSHVDEAKWQWADLHKGLDSTLNIVWNELKYKAEVIKEYGALPEVECIASQLNQVFMNLLVNAAHAIEERGTITLRTGHDGDTVWVQVADTGKGIPPENMQRIFEPFFTTKPVGKGTGLGLSLSYGIVKRHGGTLGVESRVGTGTTFTLRVPVRQPEAGAVD
jgi:signal transduction histidine kinase